MNTKEQKQYKVYRNLHNGKFSIQDKDTGLVIGHADSVVMTDCEFKVNESGRQRVLKEKRKNVHAFVLGKIQNTNNFVAFRNRELKVLESSFEFEKLNETKVTYNPYKYNSFVNKNTEESITKSKVVEIKSTGISSYN